MNIYFKLLVLTTALISVYFMNFDSDSVNLLSERYQEGLDCGLTEDFMNFLNQKGTFFVIKGYASYGFNRTDIMCGSYGGKRTSTDKIIKTPIIFIHGNSDVAFGRGTEDGYAEWQTGFRSLAAYFVASGYKKAELYTTTWGNGNQDSAKNNYHTKSNITYLRKFVEAVLQYTKATQVVIIGHSMGVTLGRKIIKGGNVVDHLQGNYSIGSSIHDKVKTFVGIAGANYGLTACYGASSDRYPTCNRVDGFYPGLLASSSPSTYLHDLNVSGGPEGSNIYSIWSKHDNVIGEQCIVWGKVTCRIPGQTSEIVKNEKEWNHFALRDNTGQDILRLV